MTTREQAADSIVEAIDNYVSTRIAYELGIRRLGHAPLIDATDVTKARQHLTRKLVDALRA